MTEIGERKLQKLYMYTHKQNKKYLKARFWDQTKAPADANIACAYKVSFRG